MCHCPMRQGRLALVAVMATPPCCLASLLADAGELHLGLAATLQRVAPSYPIPSFVRKYLYYRHKSEPPELWPFSTT